LRVIDATVFTVPTDRVVNPSLLTDRKRSTNDETATKQGEQTDKQTREVGKSIYVSATLGSTLFDFGQKPRETTWGEVRETSK
jgi:hypothetical protein